MSGIEGDAMTAGLIVTVLIVTLIVVGAIIGMFVFHKARPAMAGDGGEAPRLPAIPAAESSGDDDDDDADADFDEKEEDEDEDEDQTSLDGRIFYTPIVGEQHKNEDGSDRQAIIGKLKIGNEVEVWREPNNKFDPNAVAIRVNKRVIGYLARDVAGPVARFLDDDLENECAAIVRLRRAGRDGFIEVGLLIGFNVAAKAIDRSGPGYPRLSEWLEERDQ